MKLEIEAHLTAAQDQALHKRTYSSFILPLSDPSCRLCHNGAENTFSACSFLTATYCSNQHSAVVSMLHRYIYLSYHLPIHCDKPWLYQLESVVECNGV